jgi:Cu+-exporting ATPase
MSDTTRTLSLTIGGMSCGGCARRVHAALEAIDGAEAVEVKVGGASVCVPDDVDDDEVKAAVTRLGFSVDAVTAQSA